MASEENGNEENTMNVIKAYKGFDRDMKCRGFRYEVGKEYETEKAELCRCGFHACESPLRVWDFYPPCDGNRFCEVEQSGDIENEGENGKSVSTKIKIGSEIGIPGLVKAHVEWVKERTEGLGGSSGDAAQIGSSGGYAQIGSSGDDARIECKADHAVVACSGKNSKIKASTGTWVSLAEYGEWDGNGFPCIGMIAFQIDGEKYRPNVWYTMKEGRIVEVQNE